MFGEMFEVLYDASGSEVRATCSAQPFLSARVMKFGSVGGVISKEPPYYYELQ